MKICQVCNRKCSFNLLWELYKVWLRIIELSYLWENCCSSKYYIALLENLVNKKWFIVRNSNNEVVLNKLEEKHDDRK
jgi:hypothetical protein